MRIGLDARYLSHGLTGGVHTYVWHLARELPRWAPYHEFIFYIDDKAPFELPSVPSNVEVRTQRWSGTLSSVRNDLRLGRLWEEDRLDIAHGPANYAPPSRIPFVVTLHDTINLFPMTEHLRGFGRKPRQLAMMLYLGRMTRASLKGAAQLIAVSEHARRDIAVRTGYSLDSITTIYEAASSTFRPLDRARLEAHRQTFGLDRRAIVLADGIKNPAAAVEAFRRLPANVARAAQLVFFSREPAPRQPVQEAVASGMVRFVPQPSTEELVALMNLASVFVFPSWYEGFGLPLLEAMQCGTPVIGSSRGSIPEIIGDAGLVFDIDRPEELADFMRAVLEDARLRSSLRERALRRASEFSWERAARQTLELYDQVASRPHGVGSAGATTLRAESGDR